MKNKKLLGTLILLVGLAIAIGGFIWGQNPIGYVCVGAGIFIILIAIINILIANKKPLEEQEAEREKPEYRRKKTILSRVEYQFLQILKGVVNLDKYDIAIQVPLVAVVDKLTQNSYRNELFRVVDFCIVDNVTYAPLLLIELNDASHTRADRQERDRKVIEICESANMPIIAVTLQEMQDVNAIRKLINKNMLRK